MWFTFALAIFLTTDLSLKMSSHLYNHSKNGWYIQFSTSRPLPWRKHDSSRWSDVHLPICWSLRCNSVWSRRSSRHCIVKLKTKTFSIINLPLLIIREGLQCEDIAPVRTLKVLGIDYIGQCNFVVTFIRWKDDGWLWRGGVMVLTPMMTCENALLSESPLCLHLAGDVLHLPCQMGGIYIVYKEGVYNLVGGPVEKTWFFKWP